MDTNQVTEHLQVIRTLMERSALYRRALAPIMTYCGSLGIVAGLSGWALRITSTRSFVLFWSGIAVLSLLGAFVLVRRQALRDDEPLWSPPTKRVTQALLPPMTIGGFINILGIYLLRTENSEVQILFIILWAWFYGCAIHSAGFFTVRGMRLLSWIFVISGFTLTPLGYVRNTVGERFAPNLLMAALFGGVHLAYGIYLYFTEKRVSAP